MNGKTHKIVGVCTGVTAAVLTAETLPAATIIITSSFVGSFIPDIDEPHSFIGKKVSLLSHSLKILFGHRGIVHTPLFAAFLGFALHQILYATNLQSWLVTAVITGFMTGYISHLLLDTITPAGIMWFFPFDKKRISFQSEEFVIFSSIILSLIVIIVYFLYQNYPNWFYSFLRQ